MKSSQTIPFEDLVIQKIDNRGKTPPIVGKGYPLLEVNAISKSSVYPNVAKARKFVDQHTWDSWFRQHLKKDDILFTTVGTIAESAIVPDKPGFGVAQNILGFRFNETLINPFYALYLMRSKWFLDQIFGRTIETVQKSIKWADMRTIRLSLPTLEEQGKIVNIIKTIDEKIELNRKMNETLEQISRALFDHYFINSPDSKSWAKGTLPEIIDLNPRESIRKGVETPYLEMKNLSDSLLSINSYEIRKFNGGTKFRNNDTLLARITPCLENGKTAFVDFLDKNQVGFGSTEYIVMRPLEPVFTEYTYLLARSEVFRAYAIQSMVGTSGRQRVQNGSIAKFEVRIPELKIITHFHDQVSTFFANIKNNSDTIRNLVELRDSLLSRLISGEVES
jgi:type I restriction enzyme, S subunit